MDPNNEIIPPIVLAPGLIINFCKRMRAILAGVWIIQAAVLGIGFLYFMLLIFQAEEPRPRLVRWGGKGTSSLLGVIEVEATAAQPEWWTMSISEYGAARGTTGGKLLSMICTAVGMLIVVSGTLVRSLCLGSTLSAVFFIVGGICCVLIGQLESSDVAPDESQFAVRLKRLYGLIHLLAAIGFIGFITAAMLLSNFHHAAKAVAIAGAALFVVFCFLQSLTGAYLFGPSNCILPQRPGDRNPGHPRFAACHRWLSRPRNLTVTGRVSLGLELLAFFLVAFSFTLGAIIATGPGPCKSCPTLIDLIRGDAS